MQGKDKHFCFIQRPSDNCSTAVVHMSDGRRTIEKELPGGGRMRKMSPFISKTDKKNQIIVVPLRRQLENISMKTIYECSQSKGVKWITVIFFLIMIFSILLSIYTVSKGVNVTEAIIVMYIIAEDEGIGIRTLLRTKRISYEDIDRIERVDELFGTTKTIRLLGMGGVFGYIGLFRTKGVGTFRSYVTDDKKAFVIYRTKGMPIAISVNEPEEFMPYYMKGGTK